MQNQLKSRIMRRIYAIWFVRRIAPPAVFTALFGYLAFYEIAQSFFVAQIVSNFLATASNIWSIPGFVGAAVTSAEPQTLFIIAFLILGTFILGIKLLRNIRMIVANRGQILYGKSLLQ